MLFLDNIIVSYIIQGYSSIWITFNTTDLSWYFKKCHHCLSHHYTYHESNYLVYLSPWLHWWYLAKSQYWIHHCCHYCRHHNFIQYQWYDIYLLYYPKQNSHAWVHTIWCIWFISLYQIIIFYSCHNGDKHSFLDLNNHFKSNNISIEAVYNCSKTIQYEIY